MDKLGKLVSNIHKSPVTTVCGILFAVLLAVTHQPDAKHLGMAVLAAIWGAVQSER